MGIAEVGAPAGLELLERSLGYTRGALAGVRDDLADAPTPCARWTLVDLLRHMVDSLATLAEASVGYVAPVSAWTDRAAGPVDLTRRLCDLGCAVLGGWVNADVDEVDLGGRHAVSMPAPVLAETGALEVAVHGWDVARTHDRSAVLPPLLAAALLPVAARRVSPLDRPGRFGPSVPDPRGTDPGSLLLAHLGRRT